MGSKIIIKLVACICFTVLAIGVFAAWNFPATHYESSIYAATPLMFWIAIVFNFLWGIGIAVHQVYTKEYEYNRIWMLGLLITLFSYVSLVSLYVIRGYVWYGGSGDAASHLGWTLYIINNGHFPGQDIYPVTHILIAQAAQILNIQPAALFGYTSILFNLFYPIFMFLLANAILRNKGQVILATLASTTIVFGWWNIYAGPNQLAYLALPMAIFIFVKSADLATNKMRFSYSILLLIVLFLFPLFHPAPSLVLLFIMVTLWLPRYIYAWSNRSFGASVSRTYGIIAPAVLFFVVWLVTWISSFFIYTDTVRNISTLVTEGAPTHLQALTTDIFYAQENGYNVLQQFFKVYGGDALYLVLALIALPIIIRRVSQSPEVGRLFSWYGPMPVCGLMVVGLYFTNIVFGGPRFLPGLVLASTFFVGFLLYEALNQARLRFGRNHWSKMLIVLVPSILIMAYTSGILQAYPSPYTLNTNDQPTLTETAGMKWFLNTKDTSLDSIQITCNYSRYADFLLTPEQRASRSDLPYLEKYPAPDWHFGYTKYSTLGEQYTIDKYLILDQLDRVLYIEVLPKMAVLRFTSGDFAKLDGDPSIDKIYSNSGFDEYLVHSSKY